MSICPSFPRRIAMLFTIQKPEVSFHGNIYPNPKYDSLEVSIRFIRVTSLLIDCETSDGRFFGANSLENDGREYKKLRGLFEGLEFVKEHLVREPLPKDDGDA